MTNDVTTGSMYAVTLDSQFITAEELQSVYDEVAALKDSVTEDNVYSEEYLGKLLSLAGKLYFAQVDNADTMSADIYDVAITRSLSEGITGYEVCTSSMYGRITSLSEGNLYIDVDTDSHGVVSLNGEEDVTKEYMLSTGMTSSLYESAVWEELTGYESVSTISILAKAQEENIDILLISSINLGTEIEKLNTDEATRQSVINAVNRGMIVTIPAEDITMGQWHGTGYIVTNPETGAGEYIISGGLSGGITATEVNIMYILNIILTFVDLEAGFSIIAAGLAALSTGAVVIPIAIIIVVSGLAVSLYAIFTCIEYVRLMEAYVNGDEEAGKKIVQDGWLNLFVSILISVGGVIAKPLLRTVLKNKLVREFGEEFIEKMLRNIDITDLGKYVKQLRNMNLSDDLIKEFAEKYGKEGLEWLTKKKSLGLTDDLVRKLIKTGDPYKFADDILLAIKNSNGYADDIIEQIIKYGDDAADAIRKYGDDAADAIKRYGDEAIDGFKANKTPEEITSPTKPTIEKGSKPKGEPAKPTDEGLVLQNQAAEILADNGYDITQLPEKNGGNGYGIKEGTNPDFLINGRVFDCYSPLSTTDPDGVVTNIAKKTRNQADRIVLNLENYPSGNIELLKKRIEDKINGDLKHLKELIVIRDNKVETWFVR